MNRLRELRQKRNLTQAEFGKIFQASQNTVSNWENGNRRIDNDRLVKFAEFFDVSLEYLLGQEEYSAKAPHSSDIENLDPEFLSLLSKLSASDLQRVKDFVLGLMSARNDI